ncbi:MAG TPA: Asp-tRNA(Asn)/Glu-tRNA(Gln) amidotransferase subunit GatA [Vicinamibacteria bacterium]|nr:Asp-tRNA(Asn)/Glu-tRNA(Gln) amidotransferase subunit GatA [Vicinamibacteria bacterium]
MSLWELSLRSLRDRLATGEITAEETARSLLERIEAKDGGLGAFLLPLADSALERARTLDRLPRNERGSLHGVPIAVKDIISVEGSRTTAGSRILEGYVSPYSATAIERLADAGAVILGKTNLDEFAMGSSTENSAFQTTRNPWNPDRVPGGSSGGSAAAVAARLAPAGLGTDTGGSIRQPAALCGVVGLKPTYGRVSRYGLVAFASSFDQIGPIVRTAEDAGLVLETIAGADPKDSTSSTRPVPRYSEEIARDVRSLRVGIPRDILGEGVDESVLEAFDRAARKLAELGVALEEVSLPAAKHAIACYYVLVTAEASSNLARYDGVRYGLRTRSSGLHEMMSASRGAGFGREVKRRILLGTFVLSAGYYDAYYEKAQRVRSLIGRDFARAFERVDAVILPTSPETAFPLGAKSEDPLSMYLADVFTITANLTGTPAVSFPAGFDTAGLPIGVQLIGRHFEEGTILRLTHAFQTATDHHLRVPPLAS